MLNKNSLDLIKCFFYKEKVRDPKQILIEAEKNRLLLPIAKNLGLTDIIKEGQIWIEKLGNTNKFIEQTLGPKISYLITRTYKYVEYVTFDVDLFVSSSAFSETIKLFQKAGCQIESHDFSLGGRIAGAQVNVRKENLLTIDLHRDFTWQKRKFLDTNLLFNNTRSKKTNGIIVNIPSAEVEFLLCLADIGHERFNITLLDLIWLEGLSKEISNWQYFFDQPKKYGWNKVFLAICRIINGLSIEVYGKQIIPEVGFNQKAKQLPYFLPIDICWLSYLENIVNNHMLPITSFAYMHYCRLRYYLSSNKRMPYYDEWYKKGL